MLTWCLLAALAAGQEGPDEGAAGGLPSVDALQAKRAEIEALAGVTDERRKELADKLAEVLAVVERAVEAGRKAARMREATESAQADLAALAGEAAALELPADKDALVTDQERALDVAALKSLLTVEESALEQAQSRSADLKAAIAAEKARPAEIPAALEAAQKTLREAGAPTGEAPRPDAAAADDPMAALERWLADARRAAARAEISLLEQERLSASPRLRVLEARGEVAQRKQARAEARVAVLRTLVKRKVDAVASDAAKVAEQARRSGAPGGGLADEVKNWSEQLQQVTRRIAEVQREEADVSRQLDDLAADFDLVRRQVEVGGAGGTAAQVLLEHRRVVPDPRRLERTMREQGRRLAEARLERIRIDDELRRLPAATGPAAAGGQLTASKRKLLEELSEQYELLIREQGQLDLQRRTHLERVREYRGFLDEKLFWVPSSPPLGTETFSQLPEALRSLADPARWRETLTVLLDRCRRAPLALASAAVLVLGPWVLRRRLRDRLALYARKVRRVSTDRYGFTLKALVVTALLALPLPLLVSLLAGALWSGMGSGDWSQGVAFALFAVLPVLTGLVLLHNVCLPDGLAEAHFRWQRPVVQQLRRAITGLACGYVPALFVIALTFADPAGRHIHSLGRLTFLLAMAWVAYWIVRTLRPSGGLLSGHLQRHPGGAVARLRMFWFPLVAAAPLGFAVLAGWGYLVTGLGLSRRLHKTAAICLAGLACYELILRWFAIRERRLALQQALAGRRARREAAGQAPEPAAGDELPAPEPDDDTVDLVEVGAQTRRLLRTVVGVVVLALLWLSWGGALPVVRGLEAIRVLGQASAADVLLAVMIAVATAVVARNLPGILEIALLHKLTADTGIRYAAASLAQYAVVGAGAVGVFQALALDWSKFGWMLAALSVGLGFGLQEIVANFICGIILLFERPIRVGDVVTVGEVTGSVSRIRIRATTITDWDRKEFIVPNKQFVTGQVLNWTLSNTTTRLVLNVGVGYGSDTGRVRRLLEEIVAAHPEVLAEPAPVVVLERLGESSLDFSIRCFLGAPDRRLGVTHDLLAGIHRRLREEGIQIPFPQRDLHVLRGEH